MRRRSSLYKPTQRIWTSKNPKMSCFTHLQTAAWNLAPPTRSGRRDTKSDLIYYGSLPYLGQPTRRRTREQTLQKSKKPRPSYELNHAPLSLYPSPIQSRQKLGPGRVVQSQQLGRDNFGRIAQAGIVRTRKRSSGSTAQSREQF